MEEADKWKIEKFAGQNFGLWKVQMESLLIKQDLALALEGKAKGQGTLSDPEWEKMDKKARATIFLSLSSNVLFFIEPDFPGFEEARKGCCGTGLLETAIMCNPIILTCADPSKYVFWDSFHPTTECYQILANATFQQIRDSILSATS
ncbi:GDSL esterase/lipase EXL2-like [Cryptomeria japonica]|uniref:GDSL esterase/lipase EXL2-like n=1 Tax=Cryptomeria japonica TaxID=3369 RepID=UPI0027D9EC9C|nr:GDSL esterase/lipase EXL2-like [Cryptomeria japonica]